MERIRLCLGNTARLRRGRSDDVGYGATRLVLCLDRLPTRITHAGSNERSYMGRGTSSRLVPPSKTEHWSRRASMLGRSTLSAVGPTDATSIANNLDSRNPHVRLRTSCPRRGETTFHQCLILPRPMSRRRSPPPCKSIDGRATWVHCSTA